VFGRLDYSPYWPPKKTKEPRCSCPARARRDEVGLAAMRSCICISRDAIARTGRDCIGCDAPAPAAFIDRADGPRVLLTSAGFGGIARGTGSRETPMPSSQPTTPPSQYTRAKNIKNSINQFEIPLQNQIRYLNHCIIGLKLSQCKNLVGIELGRTGHFAQSLRLSIRKLSGASDAGSRSKSTSQAVTEPRVPARI